MHLLNLCELWTYCCLLFFSHEAMTWRCYIHYGNTTASPKPTRPISVPWLNRDGGASAELKPFTLGKSLPSLAHSERRVKEEATPGI